jgi:hypothetical protein
MKKTLLTLALLAPTLLVPTVASAATGSYTATSNPSTIYGDGDWSRAMFMNSSAPRRGAKITKVSWAYKSGYENSL